MAPRQTKAKTITRMSGEDRRNQIIDVAIRLFSQKGFRGTTTREIALAAGVNEAIIFRHFATKHDLYTAIIDHKAGSDEFQTLELELQKAMKARDDRRVFESLAFNIIEYHSHDDSLMRLIYYSALEGHELADIFFRNQVSKRHRMLADYIKQRINEGAFRRVDPLTVARSFFGIVIYHSMISMFYESGPGSGLLQISNRLAAERYAELILSSMTGSDAPAPHSGRRLTRRK